MPKKTILVIDDEKRFAELLKLSLEQLPEYEGVVATTADEGLELVKTRRPDLILLDLRLPGHDGVELLKQIKATDAGIPVAMVTGVFSEEEARRCFAAGAYDYITKPVDFDYLKRVLLVKLF